MHLFKNFNIEKPIYSGIEEKIPTTSLPKQTETVVIGGGLLGLSTALELAEAGKEVVVLESKNIGDGPSGRSGGQLWPGYDMYISEMKNTFGAELTIKTWGLTQNALKKIHERISIREDKCDFVPGLLFTSKTKQQKSWIENEMKVLQELGMNFASYLTKEDIQEKFISTNFYFNGILYLGTEKDGQYGHINPLKYTRTIASLAHKKGAILIENCQALSIDHHSGDIYTITTEKGEIVAKNIVFATGADFLRPKGAGFDLIPRTFIPAQGIILVTEIISKELANEIIPSGMCFCDASTTAMSFVSLIKDSNFKDGYRLTFGGADAIMQAEVELEIPKIEREMRTIFPQLDREHINVEKVWGGNCDLSRNALPFIDNPKTGIYHASGFTGQGMVNTSLYGSVIAEKILNKDTGKFETLKKLNPPPYSRSKVIAWLQAAERVAIGLV